MADSKGGFGSFPWASVAVLVAFVASTQLVPHAFESLRPAEKARAQAPLDPDLEVNARLWEDPFSALRRYEAERAERCDRARKQASQKLDVDCLGRLAEMRDPHRLMDRLDGDQNQKLGDTLIVLGLMPGADFVGAEEARRRIRYATLAGLLAQDYVPENAERLSLLEFDLLKPGLVSSAAVAKASKADPPDPGQARASFVVPYEMLSLRTRGAEQTQDGKPPARYAQVAVLWVDESSLPLRKLDALARVAEQLMGKEASDIAKVRFDGGDALPPSRGHRPLVDRCIARRAARPALRCGAEQRGGHQAKRAGPL